MGANNSSSWHQTNNNALTSTLPMKNQVIHFHSSATWKIHFDSLKQTNKLVIFILHDFSSNISNKIISYKSSIIDFIASWCGPCRHMEPVINDFASTYTDVEFIKIDVDELDDVAQEYGVQAMPTFVLIKQGKLVDQLVGADKDGLKKKIEINRA